MVCGSQGGSTPAQTEKQSYSDMLTVYIVFQRETSLTSTQRREHLGCPLCYVIYHKDF